eukprot:scaffold81635_cov24-Tisochrysis_lutea.AAC.1
MERVMLECVEERLEACPIVVLLEEACALVEGRAYAVFDGLVPDVGRRDAGREERSEGCEGARKGARVCGCDRDGSESDVREAVAPVAGWPWLGAGQGVGGCGAKALEHGEQVVVGGGEVEVDVEGEEEVRFGCEDLVRGVGVVADAEEAAEWEEVDLVVLAREHEGGGGGEL